MKRKGILFALLLSICFASIIFIPITGLFKTLPYPYLKITNVVLKGLVLAAIYLFIIKKWQLGAYGGFSNHFKRNYWMLIIPFLFPGYFAYKSFTYSCNELPVIILLFITIVQGVWEEVNFRGIIQGYLIKTSSQPQYHRIFLYTSALFALGHLINLRSQHPMSVTNQVIYAFLTGLMFSAIQFHVNNTWLLGFAHGLLNFFFKSCNPFVTTVEDHTEPAFWEYISQAALVFLVFSPMLLIYWLLMKKLKKPDRSSFNR
jgi:membrane protease YdiL (CAAX protease family)